MLFQRIFKKLIAGTCALFATTNAALTSWIITKDNIETDFSLTKTDARVVCYNKNTSVDYTSLKTALDNATSGQEVIVYIGANATCNETITIKSGVTLTIPFLGKAFNSTKTGNNISTTETLFKIGSADDRDKYGDNTLGDVSTKTVETYRSAIVNMRNGADIINNGTLNLGGKYSTKGNNGYYSEINLGSGSSIQCKNGSVFECYGYVKESSEDYINPTNVSETHYDNRDDVNRFIEMGLGSKLITQLSIYDAPTAGSLTMLMNAEQCPFWEWDFSSLQTYVKVDSGSTFVGVALLVGPSNKGVSKEITIFSNATGSESMFYLEDGYVGIEYVTDNPLYSSRDFGARKENFYFNGKTSIGYIYVNESVANVKMEMDTRKSFLPVSCRAKMIIPRGKTFTSDKKLKYLAGSEMLIEEGGTFEINNEVIFHRADSMELNTGSGIYYRNDSDKTRGAKLVCNGTISFNTDKNKNGALGAFVENTNLNGTAKIDLNSLTDENKLSVKETEGFADYIIKVTSHGLFDGNDAWFKTSGSYLSNYSNASYNWKGNYALTYDIKIMLSSKDENLVSLVSIYYSDDANGTNEKETDLILKTTIGEASAPRNKYVKIGLIRGVKATTRDEKGNLINSSYGTYFQLDRNIVIEIEPSETYKLNFTLTSDNGKYDGSGHFLLELWESKTKDGAYTKVLNGKYGDYFQPAAICKDSYFYLKRPFDNETLYNKFKNENATITKDPDIGDKSSWNLKKKEQSPTYLADANYTIATKWDYSGTCFDKGTSISTNRGEVLVENLRQSDLLKTYNHLTGEYEFKSIAAVIRHKEEPCTLIHLTFSNGKNLRFIQSHGLFDVTINKYVDFNPENCNKFIGHEFISEENGNNIYVKLEKVSLTEKTTTAYTVVSSENLNCVANGMLNITSVLTGIYNIFSYDQYHNYDLNEYEKDIQKYGLYEYSDFSNKITEKIFVDFGFKYFRISISKGYLTEETLEYYIKWFKACIDDGEAVIF